jgi:hypothetical protein
MGRGSIGTARALALALLVLALPATAQAAGPTGVLDSRGWEMVSPVEKNGGEVAPLGEGVLQAASQGGELAFASEASFAEGQGAAPLSQYLSSRGTEAWSAQNVTPPLLAGTYSSQSGDPDPYLLFSADLSRALLSGGWACRDGSSECEAENTPLGPAGPAGYRNAYVQEGASYQPLITTTNFPALPAEAKEFQLQVEGASPDLRHVAFVSAGLLYEWSEGTIAQVGGAGATLAAKGNQLGAVSEDGSRLYFAEAGDLKLREGGSTKPVCEACAFGAASSDGATAYYLAAGHLHRYLAATEADEDLAPSGGATAILGTSPDGAYLFYLAAGGIFRWHAGTATKVINDANLSHLPPATGPSTVAANGNRFFFTAADSLAPLADSNGQPDAYEWEAQGTGSCSASPGCLGLISSGRSGSGAFAAASASGDDAYFLTTASLLPADTGVLDVYDARAGGGFPEPQPGIECTGDDCQGPPFVPQDPAPTTAVVSGPENPPLEKAKNRCPKGKKLVKRHGKKVCKKKGKRKGHGGR